MQMRVLTTSWLLLVLIISACGDEIKRGNAGESCTAANDCAEGLACIALVCVTSDESAQSDAVNADSDKGSTSCGARRDCPEGSMCIDNSCKALTMGMSTDARQGGRGESCAATNDCGPDLSCLAGMCRETGITLQRLPKSCYKVECESTEDCCATFVPNANCDMYKKNCETDAIFCNTYRSLCECSKTCDKEQCVMGQPGCKTNAECTSAQTPFCVDGTCHQCDQDSACPGEMSKCAAGVCMSPCTDDANCPLLYACQDNACVMTGCTSDRECAFINKNSRAVCKDKKCQSPCAGDGDCVSQDPLALGFQVCDEGECKFVGCESDIECRAALNIAAQAGKVRAVCR